MRLRPIERLVKIENSHKIINLLKTTLKIEVFSKDSLLNNNYLISSEDRRNYFNVSC